MERRTVEFRKFSQRSNTALYMLSENEHKLQGRSERLGPPLGLASFWALKCVVLYYKNRHIVLNYSQIILY